MVPTSAASSDRILHLNENDVLLGRGIGPRQQEGNGRMSLLVEERKKEYMSEKSYKRKACIAKGVHEMIRTRGGRFVRPAAVASNTRASQEGFVEAEKGAGLEKIKQALREKVSPKGVAGAKRKLRQEEEEDVGTECVRSSDVVVKREAPRDGNKEESWSPSNAMLEHEVARPATITSSSSLGNAIPVAANLVDAFSSGPETAAAGCPPPMPVTSDTNNLLPPVTLLDTTGAATCPPLDVASSTNSVLPPSTLLDTTSSAAVDSRLVLFQTVPYAFQQQLATNTVRQIQLKRIIQQEMRERQLAEAMVRSRLQQQDESMATASTSTAGIRLGSEEATHTVDSFASMTDIAETPTSASNEQALLNEDISDLLLSTVGYSEDTIFTEEQEAMERASLTQEERVEALSDMLGKMSLSSSTANQYHQRKRTRRDLDTLSVMFLVNQMRVEIEEMTQGKKQALIEAQSKCRQEEFSDDRLEQFLRFEGMNPKLGAQRFVEYWNARREVFGQDKYTLRMTLSEALRDDMDALNAGVYYLLPHLDLSGRRLLYITPWRHTRENYDTDSLLRVIWYFMEIIADESNETGNGFNCIVFDKHTTIWDIDPKLNDRTTFFYQKCWPVKAMATHICPPPLIMMLFLKPVMLALMSKDVRSRLRFHDGAEGEILQSLADYGILPSMLPKEMAGAVEMNLLEWIDNRRAVELEGM